MWKATWKGILGHKVRLALTALAVVLGVGFVSGTFVLTDTLNAVFDDLFADAFSGLDVVVREQEGPGGATQPGYFDEDVIERVRTVEGVEVAEGSIGGFAQIIGEDGEPIGGQGPPTFGTSWPESEEVSPLTLRDGRAPSGPREVAVDAATAEGNDITVGEEIRIAFQGPAETFGVVGIVGFGDADNLAGATLAVFDLRTAQRVLGHPGELDSIAIVAGRGVGAEELRSRVARVLPEDLEAVTSTTVQAETAAEIQEGLGFFTIGLLVFAGISLFVGAFIIHNTFGIVVAQRAKEFALLRALGASRRQVLRSVVVESLITGFAASVVGLGAGFAIAVGLKGLLGAFGLDLPQGGTVFLPRTIVVALATGTLVTLVSSLIPARRASRIPPVAALREETPGTETVDTARAFLGAPAAVLGFAIIFLGLRGIGNGALLVGIGAIVVFVGVTVAAPAISRPVARGLGLPIQRWFRIPGKLARENASRNPRRTASTAAALMVGLALVALVAVLTASLKSSVRRILDDTLAADFIVTPETRGEFFGVGPEVVDRLEERDELGRVAGLRLAEFELVATDDDVGFVGADPRALDGVVDVEVVSGELAALGPGEVFVEADAATDLGVEVGDTLAVRFADTGEQELLVSGIYEFANLVGASYLLSTETYDANVVDPVVGVVYVQVAPGVQAQAAREAIEAALADFPTTEVVDQTEFKEESESQLDQLLGLVTALLGLAIVIALLGITNTLALSILERTRELGLLRAVGMSRRQVRSMVRWEAVLIAVLGAVLGLPIGVFFAWAVVEALSDQGIVFAVPPVQLLVYLVLAGVAGVGAAILPARRAARLDVLDAISME